MPVGGVCGGRRGGGTECKSCPAHFDNVSMVSSSLLPHKLVPLLAMYKHTHCYMEWKCDNQSNHHHMLAKKNQMEAHQHNSETLRKCKKKTNHHP